MAEAIVDQIFVYPVKSLGGVKLAEAGVTSAGSLAGDREWLVVTPDGQMLWQGDIPRMTLIRVSLAPDVLTLGFDGAEPLRVPIDAIGPDRPVTMYKRQFTGTDMGDGAAQWLSDILSAAVRLVRIGDGAHRWDGLNPVHVISDVSLAALNEALAAQGDDAVSPLRFRPNIILQTSGLSPWFEERTPILDLGSSRIVLREPCQRCELPNISLLDASRQKQPLKLIGQLAKSRTTATPASFGTYAAIEGTHVATGMRAPVADAAV